MDIGLRLHDDGYIHGCFLASFNFNCRIANFEYKLIRHALRTWRHIRELHGDGELWIAVIRVNHCYSAVMWTDLAATLRDGEQIHGNSVGTGNRDTSRDSTTILILYFTIFKVFNYLLDCSTVQGGWVVEWLACWTQAQKGPGSNRSRDAVGQQS